MFAALFNGFPSFFSLDLFVSLFGLSMCSIINATEERRRGEGKMYKDHSNQEEKACENI